MQSPTADTGDERGHSHTVNAATRVNSSHSHLWSCGLVLVTDACDEMRLSVEFVTVGFLGICRQYCCD